MKSKDTEALSDAGLSLPKHIFV